VGVGVGVGVIKKKPAAESSRPPAGIGESLL
jgi:hypothetical protein